jgi:cell division protein FtsB
MNPDGTANQKPDLTSPVGAAFPSENRSPEIIDVRVVEEISSVPEPLEDVWTNDEATNTQSTADPSIPTTTSVSQEQPAHSAPTDVANSALDDNWGTLLDEIAQASTPNPAAVKPEASNTAADAQVAPLLRAEAEIKAEIAKLQATQTQLQQQIVDTQTSFGQIILASIDDLEQRRQKLQISIEQLERRRDRIKAEINKSFAGGSQDIAIRLQGFKDYLVGSLQDLVVIAEEIEFPQPPPAQIRLQTPIAQPPISSPASRNQPPQFAEPTFKTTAGKVRSAIDRYRNAPDYYAPTWQLRRTLEAVHADKVSDWFFTKDGRGAIRTMGSRLQNILVAATAVSALRELYGDYLRTLVLANLPERLGDWRRGFQDCLGLSKTDFGANGGIILFEDPDALVQKVDRILANKEMPLIIIDNSEGQIALSILQYPLWLAFAPDPSQQPDDYREYR